MNYEHVVLGRVVVGYESMFALTDIGLSGRDCC